MAFTVQGVIQLITDDYNKTLDKAKKDGESTAGAIQSAFGKIGNIMNGLKKAIPVVAIGAACKGIYNMAKATADAGDAIDKNSQKIGLSRKAYQEWGYVLGQNGASIDSMGKALKTMTTNMASGSASASEALQKIGLSMDKLTGKSTEAQFQMMVEGLQGMADGSEKMLLAQTLFGQSARDLMPLLNAESGSVQELMQRAHDLGLVLNDETITASAAFGDALDDMTQSFNRLKLKFGSLFLKPLTTAFTTLADTLGKLSVAFSDSLTTGDWSMFFSTLTEELSAGVPKLVSGLMDVAIGVIANIDKVVQLAGAILVGLAQGLVRAVPTFIGKIPGVLGAIGSALKGTITALFGNIFSPLYPVIDSFINTFGGVFDTVYNMLTGKTTVIDGIYQIFDDLFGDGKDGTSGLLGLASNVLAMFSGLVQNILTALGVPENTKTSIMNWVNTTFADFLSIGNDIVGIFTGANSPDGKSLIQRVIDALTVDGTVATRMNGAIKALFGSNKPGQLSGLLGIAGKISLAFSGLVGNIIAALTGDISKAGQIGNIVNQIFAEPLNIVESIINTFTGKGEGENHKKGLIERIQDIFDPANNTGFVDKINEFLKTLFGIGDNAEAGIGINGVITDIQKAFNGVIDGVAALFNIDPNDKRVTDIKEGFDILFGGVTGIVSSIVTAFTGEGEGDAHQKGIIEQIADVFNNPGNWAQNISGALASLFGVNDGATTGVIGVINTVEEMFKGLMGKIAGALGIDESSASWQGIMGFFGNITGLAKNVITDIVAIFSGRDNADGTHTKGILQEISDIFNGRTDFTTGLRNTFKTLFGLDADSEGGINGLIADINAAFDGLMDSILMMLGVDTNSQQYKDFKEGIDSVFGFVQNVVQSIGKTLTGTFDEDGNQITKGLLDFFNELFDPDVSWAQRFDTLIGSIIGTSGQNKSGLLGLIESLKQPFEGLLDNVLSWIFGDNPSDPNSKSSQISGMLTGMFDGIINIGNVIANTFRGTDGQGGLLQQIHDIIIGDGTWAQKITGIWTALLGSNEEGKKSGIYGFADTIINTIKGIPGAVAKFILGEDSEWAQLIDEYSQTLGDGFMDMFGGVSTFITSITDFLGKLTSGDFSGSIQALIDGLFGPEGLMAGFQDMTGSLLSGAISGLAHLIGLDISPAEVASKWNAIANAILAPIRWVLSIVSKIVEGIQLITGHKSGFDPWLREVKGGEYAEYANTSLRELAEQYMLAELNQQDTSGIIEQMMGIFGTNLYDGGSENYNKYLNFMAALSTYMTDNFYDGFNPEDVKLPEGWFSASAGEAVADVQAALNGADFVAGLTLEPTVAGDGAPASGGTTGGGGSPGRRRLSRPGHATGLDYVPFDDYVSRLHRGEAVLSAFEAAAWRERGQLAGGSMGNTYNDSSTLYVGQMYMSSDLDAAQLQQTLATLTRRRNRSYGA